MLLLKVTLLWSMTLVAAALLRRAHAADRHRLWTIGFAAVLLLPLLTPIVPSLDIPVPSWRSAAAAADIAPAGVTIPRWSGDLSRPQPGPESLGWSAVVTRIPGMADRAHAGRTFSWPSPQSACLAIWAIGTGSAIAMILLSLARVNRLRQTGRELHDESWHELTTAVRKRIGFAPAVRLIVHDSVTTPMAGGIWQPAIFLPTSSHSWSSDQRAVVLAHELAHLRGRDPLRLIAARLAVAVYWFHPLAWLAARQSTVAREQACDAAVLAIGTRPSTYARVLLDLAESMGPRPQPVAALPIVERSLLEMRLMEILNDDSRRPPRSRVLLPLTLAAALTLTLAAAHPLASTTATPVPIRGATLHPVTAPTAAPEWPAVSGPPRQRRDNGFSCWSGAYGSSFNGTITSSGSVVTRQIGSSGADRIIEENLGDLRVCMIAQNVSERDTDDAPSAWIGRADRIEMETRRGSQVLRLTLDGPTDRAASWTVNGTDRPFDAAAQQWRDRLLGVLDASWQISSIRGHVSSLRGEISSIRGEESSLRGEISSLHGEVSSMRGRQSGIRGDESSLRGEISSIRGHVSSLRGEISSQEGEISSLTATRDDASASDRSRIDASVARHQDEIKRIERELRDYDEDAKIAEVEKQIKALDADGTVRAIDDEIRQFDVDGKVARIEQQIRDLDVAGKTTAIEKQIDGLDADRKVRDLETRRDQQRADLQAALNRIR